MGYQTDFTGTLKFTRPMSNAELAFIKTIANFDYDTDAKDLYAPHGKPHYVQLEVSKDNSGIQWDGSEKFYEAVNAVNFVIDNVRREIPDFGLSGQLEAQGEEIGDHWFLSIGVDGFASRVDTADKLALDYVELAGELASCVEWAVNNEGECLGDHPSKFAYFKEVLSKAVEKRQDQL